MLPRCLFAAFVVLACSPAIVPSSAARGVAVRLVTAQTPRASAEPFVKRHASARLAPPFAHGTGTRRIADGEARTALVATP
jgi:hypothetical protein